MYQIDFNHPANVYFIGIGGISMSGFAQLLHDYGFQVHGSDAHESKITDHLQSLGIDIIYGQSTENITNDIDLVRSEERRVGKECRSRWSPYH